MRETVGHPLIPILFFRSLNLDGPKAIQSKDYITQSSLQLHMAMTLGSGFCGVSLKRGGWNGGGLLLVRMLPPWTTR